MSKELSLNDIPEHFPAPPLDQFNYALKRLGDMSMRLVIDLAGRLDEARLARACIAAIRQAPVLGSRFVEAESPVWEILLSLNIEDLVQVTLSQDPDGDLMKTLTGSLDPGRGPQVRLSLIRGERDILCITVSHAAMDAHGLLAFSALLAMLYRDEHLGDTIIPERSDRSLTPLLAGLSPGTLERLARPAEKFVAGWKFPETGAPGTERRYAIRTLPASRLIAIRGRGREYGATVNDILLAAYYTALREVINPENGIRVQILVTIDLRRYFSGEAGMGREEREGFTGPGDRDFQATTRVHALARTIANRSVAFPLLVPVAERTFGDTIVLMHALMREKKEHYPGLASALETEAYGPGNFSKFQDRVRERESASAEIRSEPPFIGNIGVVPTEVYAFAPDLPVNNAFVAGIIVNPPGLTFGITTCNGMLTLSIGYCSPAITEESVEGLLDRILSCLPSG
ncbi:MAG: hypothetical protein METHP_00091 [Methanoregula sp. SKADARSKE-2]|nr:MAG: hypothetical protein METHP_00091 [Methanoregula sp. SKADARSKE-2]